MEDEGKIISLAEHRASKERYKKKGDKIGHELSKNLAEARELSPDLFADVATFIGLSLKAAKNVCEIIRNYSASKMHDGLAMIQATPEQRKQLLEDEKKYGKESFRSVLKNAYVALQRKEDKDVKQLTKEADAFVEATERSISNVYHINGGTVNINNPATDDNSNAHALRA